MKTKLIILALTLGASMSLLTAQDKPAPDGKGPPPQGGPGRGGVHLLPRDAKEKLKLTDDQQKQVSDLEAETTSKLEKILTPEQMEQLKQMRPQGRGGPGGGGKGGQGGKQGGKPPGPPPADNK